MALGFGKRPPSGIGSVSGFGGVERRRSRRMSLNVPGSIRYGLSAEVPCVVVSLSGTGAALVVESVFGIPQEFELYMSGHPDRHVTVVRQSAGRLHVRFRR